MMIRGSRLYGGVQFGVIEPEGPRRLPMKPIFVKSVAVLYQQRGTAANT